MKKAAGVSIFLLGFILFNGVYFMERYELTTSIIEDHIPEPQRSLFKQVSFNMAMEYDNTIVFSRALDEVFVQANNLRKEKYSFDEYELDQFMSQLKGSTLTEENVEKVFQNEDPEKERLFRDYGGWLISREFSSRDELHKALSDVFVKINSYGIEQSLGFNKYLIKDIKYNLIRHSSSGWVSQYPVLILSICLLCMVVGALLYQFSKYGNKMPGIKNDGIFKSTHTSRGWLGILTGTWLIAFYLVLYFYQHHITPWVILTDPISFWLKGSSGGPFFLYGFLYTLAILVMGYRMILKYRHSRYQIFRTVSVMFFQLAFAFLIPEILVRFNQPYYDFKNMWPLDYDFFFNTELDKLVSSGGLGIFMIVWGIILFTIAVPILVYFFGKRWYCSWVCGCGGLAETLGDPYRHLSDKSIKAWKVERWMIHGVLVFSVVMTVGVLYTYFTGASNIGYINTYQLREIYGAWIGAGFAGVVGTGFYPLMGNRVWCRFGCPLAAYMGIVQRFKSRFRITTNGGQCISCGNCSTYCEMGIDVRWYAQRQQDIVRASCVGCGVCSEVCPRGVLKLESTKVGRRV